MANISLPGEGRGFRDARFAGMVGGNLFRSGVGIPERGYYQDAILPAKDRTIAAQAFEKIRLFKMPQ